MDKVNAYIFAFIMIMEFKIICILLLAVLVMPKLSKHSTVEAVIMSMPTKTACRGEDLLLTCKHNVSQSHGQDKPVIIWKKGEKVVSVS